MSEENAEVVVDSPAPEVNQSEVEARKFGWVPKEEWAGPEDKWKPADDFLARGKEINGFLRRDFEIVNNKLSAKEQEINQLRQTVEEFAKFHEETEKRAYERAKKELNDARKRAIELGDGDAFIQVEEELASLEANPPKPKTVAKPQANNEDVKVLNNWLDENPTFKNDIEVMGVADGLSFLVKQEHPDLKGKDFLDKLAERVKATIPHKFENGNRTRASAVGASSDSGTGRSGSKKKGYADLPPEAKAACDKFVKAKLLTVDKYVEDYFQGE
jgi:hypothetical protein